MSLKRVLLIDGTGLQVKCERAGRNWRHDGQRSRPLAEGVPVAYLFARSVTRFVRAATPTHVLVAFDGKDARRWRQERYALYKANRADPPQARTRAEEIINEFLSYAHLPTLDLEGFEADDIIAWAVWKYHGNIISIRSDDADLHQLLKTGVLQWPLSGDAGVMDAELAEKKYGVPPYLLPKLRALAGDKSDNIPGIPGIGPKTAARLLTETDGQLDAVVHKTFDANPHLRELAHVFWEISSLPRRTAMLEARAMRHNSLFSPLDGLRWVREAASEDVAVFFRMYDMATLTTALEAGRLW